MNTYNHCNFNQQVVIDSLYAEFESSFMGTMSAEKFIDSCDIEEEEINLFDSMEHLKDCFVSKVWLQS